MRPYWTSGHTTSGQSTPGPAVQPHGSVVGGTTLMFTTGVKSPNHVTSSCSTRHWKEYGPGVLGAVRVNLSRPKCFRLERQFAGRVFHPVGTCALPRRTQRLRRAAVALAQVRRRVPQGLPRPERSAHEHRLLAPVLQPAAASPGRSTIATSSGPGRAAGRTPAASASWPRTPPRPGPAPALRYASACPAGSAAPAIPATAPSTSLAGRIPSHNVHSIDHAILIGRG
jgi:hypothetical protein